MFPASLLSTLLLALTCIPLAHTLVVDKPLVTLAISRRWNSLNGGNLYRHDFNRAQALKARGRSGQDTKREYMPTPQENPALTYVATVGIGSPPTDYTLVVDTGSSNTWVGAAKSYVKTSSSQETPDTVSVAYGSGSFNGTEYNDVVDLGGGLVVQQSIGVASHSTGFDDQTDGILGIGPTELTKGTLSPDETAIIPTVTDNLFSSGKITEHSVAIAFDPSTSNAAKSGEISWGGVDQSKYTGEITFVPITGTSPASTFWGIDQSITYGENAVLSTTAGIVDTGTTLLLIATDAFQTYQKLTGAQPDSSTSLLRLSGAQYDTLQSLYFHIGGVSFEFTPNAQIWPRSLNTAIGGSSGSIYLVVADNGQKSGSGLDFVNGYVWLQRFYSVYDTANSRVGIATTPFTDATTN